MGRVSRKRKHWPETVDRGEDLRDRTEWDIADTAEAILDARRLLADDRHLVFAQQIVGFVDAPGGRVLDRQNREVDVSALERVDRCLVGRCHHQLAVDLTRREILLGREKAERVAATHGDAHRHLVLEPREARYLPAHRFGEEVAIDASDEIDRGALGSSDVLDSGKNLTLAVRIANRRVRRSLFLATSATTRNRSAISSTIR